MRVVLNRNRALPRPLAITFAISITASVFLCKTDTDELLIIQTARKAVVCVSHLLTVIDSHRQTTRDAGLRLIAVYRIMNELIIAARIRALVLCYFSRECSSAYGMLMLMRLMRHDYGEMSEYWSSGRTTSTPSPPFARLGFRVVEVQFEVPLVLSSRYSLESLPTRLRLVLSMLQLARVRLSHSAIGSPTPFFLVVIYTIQKHLQPSFNNSILYFYADLRLL